ncbi:MAG: hypothetical protein U0235_30385 [Polyangiaceae bacterium]
MRKSIRSLADFAKAIGARSLADKTRREHHGASSTRTAPTSSWWAEFNHTTRPPS